MSGVLDIFRSHGRLNKPLLVLFCAILLLLLINAFLHDPTTGYDAHDHLNYVQSLATHGRLPTKAETGQYYSPPLPYALPALLTALHAGLWKALKFSQFFNALLAAALLYYLLKVCELLSPQNMRLKLLSLGMLGLLPVFYRSFALIRGEPYLAFLTIFIIYESLLVFLKRQYSAKHILSLGAALGLAILARQWGFFLFPPVLVFAAWIGFSQKQQRLRPLGIALSAILIALLVGGWFYILILRQYGTLTAFDRAPQKVSAANISALAGIDASASKLISDPIRPSLSGRLFPILYADTWGDYWGYFLVYARNINTGDFEDGIAFQKLTTPAQVPANFSTDRFTINRYLGVLNLLDLLPSALLLAGVDLWLHRIAPVPERTSPGRYRPRAGSVSNGVRDDASRICMVPAAVPKRCAGRGPDQSDLFASGIPASRSPCRKFYRPALGSPPKVLDCRGRGAMLHIRRGDPRFRHALCAPFRLDRHDRIPAVYAIFRSRPADHILDTHPILSRHRRRAGSASGGWPADIGLRAGPQRRIQHPGLRGGRAGPNLSAHRAHRSG